jgi:hypothetical protein
MPHDVGSGMGGGQADDAVLQVNQDQRTDRVEQGERHDVFFRCYDLWLYDDG